VQAARCRLAQRLVRSCGALAGLVRRRAARPAASALLNATSLSRPGPATHVAGQKTPSPRSTRGRSRQVRRAGPARRCARPGLVCLVQVDLGALLGRADGGHHAGQPATDYGNVRRANASLVVCATPRRAREPSGGFRLLQGVELQELVRVAQRGER
jgi:hypothetical protein